MFGIKRTIITLILVLFATVSQAKITCKLAPDSIVEGEYFYIIIESDGKGELKLDGTIPNVTIAGTGYSKSMVNGVYSQQLRLSCYTDKTGDVLIASFPIKVDGKVEYTPNLRLKVTSAEELLRLSKPNADESLNNSNKPDPTRVVSVIGFIENSENAFYVGELIPLSIHFYYQSDYARLTDIIYPEMDLGKAIITDFSSVNRKSNKFYEPQMYDRTIDGVNYSVVSFITAFQPLATGKVQLTAEVEARLRIRSNGQQVTDKFVAKMPEISVKSLPTPPADSYTLRLIGDWQVDSKINKQSVKAGDSIILQVNLTGNGGINSLVAPEISIPNCRVYPAEVTKNGNHTASLSYIIIPLEEGRINEEVKFVTFDSTKEEYQYHYIPVNLDVARGSEHLVTEQPEVEQYKPSANELKRLVKIDLMGEVKLPFYLNKLYYILFFLLVGPVTWLVICYLNFQKKRRLRDPKLLRRYQAFGQRRKVVNRLEDASDDELCSVVTQEVVPFINDLLGYPQGTNGEEIANMTKNKQLAELLHTAVANDYVPVAQRKVENPKVYRETLVKLLKKLSIVLVIFLSLVSYGNSWSEVLDSAYGDDKAQTMSMLEEFYNPQTPDPVVLYNIGSVAWQQEDYAKALWAFELTHLLSPRDHETIDALNVLRRKFYQSQVGSSDTTLAMLASTRDWFRPDDYMLVGSILFCAIFVLLIFRNKMSKVHFIAIVATLFVGVVCCGVLVRSQLNSTYSPNRALVMSEGAMLRTIPSASEEVGARNIAQGTQIFAQDAINGFCAVKVDELNGFMKESDIKMILK